jgi:hypothetical protein
MKKRGQQNPSVSCIVAAGLPGPGAKGRSVETGAAKLRASPALGVGSRADRARTGAIMSRAAAVQGHGTPCAQADTSPER